MRARYACISNACAGTSERTVNAIVSVYKVHAVGM